MGRTKSTPVKFNHSIDNLTPFRKRRKSTKTLPSYPVLPPNESNVQYYLGDVSLGVSNNVLPESWTRCKVKFKNIEDNDLSSMQMEFDTDVIVLVTVTNDLDFVKGLFTTKIFAMRFTNQEDHFKAQLFISKLPLPVFTNKIGNVLKTAIASTFGIPVEESESVIIHEEVAKETNELYKNIKIVRDKSTNIPAVCVQHPFLKPTLRPYQEDAVRWMIMREKEPENTEMLHPLYQPLALKTGTVLYYNKYVGYIDGIKPVVPSLRTGGVLADEMGLGKTVEVLACISSHPKPDKLDNETLNTVDIQSAEKLQEEEEEKDNTPIVQLQPRKHKMEPETDFSENAYCTTPKRIKVSDDWVKGSSKKSETRVALEMWYNNVLNGFSAGAVNNTSRDKVQCVCGNRIMRGALRCVDCFKYQHALCVGYKKAAGAYRCPQCWLEQPYLESKATLIVCPLTLRTQWSEEICKHLKAGLKVLIYEGSKAAPVYPTDLCRYDLVLTTYNVLLTELKLVESTQPITLRREPRYSAPGSPLARINWWRLCLDEAQTVEVPSSMISTMAKKLQAHHRWAITGTPITKNIADLYGLIDYLQLYPYNEFETWKYLLYLPYLSGNTEPMLQFLAQVLWRSSKKSVIEQINIPNQTVNEYQLEFSAVEKYYYKHEHELCTSDFLAKLKKCNLNIPLRTLDKSSLKNLMKPMRSIRNACTHPGATKGRYLASRKTVTSMQDLLDALIEKNLNDSEENLRIIVSALNGLAGIYLLLQNAVQAVEEYRKVLQMAARFNSDDPKKGLVVDKLQLIHAMHNLAEVLETSPPVQPTLRDHTLRQDCINLQQKYIERYVNQNITAYEESMAAIDTVSTLKEKYTLVPGQWYTSLIEWVTTQNLTMELYSRTQTLLENASSDKLKYLTDERKLLYLVATWDDDINDLRMTTIELLDKMYDYSVEDEIKFTVNEGLVQAAMDCHLRPQKHSKKKNKCLVCKVSVQMRQYEAKLFDMAKVNDTEDISNKGSWKPTSEELVLKGLLSLARFKNAEKEYITNGEVFFNVLEAMKKEFKILRRFWILLDQQICANDEINMCKTRLTLKQPSEENGRRQSGTDRLLKNLSYVLENRVEFINVLEEHEMLYQISLLRSEEKQNMAALEKNLGTHSYLETLRGQQFAGQNPDPCPICKNPLQEHWSILPCGHCYCLECIQVLLDKAHSQRIHCSICRQSQKIDDVSYIRTGEDDSDQSDVRIRGNYSTKIEAIVKLIMKLKTEDPDVKILVFSTWLKVLHILKDALHTNDIIVEKLDGPHNLQRSLNYFKDKDADVTALLLPISLGSKGLNLIEATHVILVEPLLNPADELQAIGRVHRIGQTRPTTVHKFIIKNTIEESIHHATSANADIWDEHKVTLLQLKNLFIDSLEDHSILDITENQPVVQSDQQEDASITDQISQLEGESISDQTSQLDDESAVDEVSQEEDESFNMN